MNPWDLLIAAPLFVVLVAVLAVAVWVEWRAERRRAQTVDANGLRRFVEEGS